MDLLEQLKEANAELETVLDRFDSYMGNNPNKYRSGIKNAREKCDVLIRLCKIEGLIPYTEDELLNEKLSRAFPNAQSKQVVEFEGVKYKNTFTPRSISNSGKTIKSWDQAWVKQ